MNFKNLEKCDILKMRKNLLQSKFKCLVFLKSTRQTALKVDIQLQSKRVFFKKHDLACITKTKRRLKVNFSERQLKFCPLNCTYLSKNSF